MVAAILIGVIVLGILVLIHEFGHFIVAKLNGVRVLAFSIGFGAPLIKKTIGGTEYRISAIPFGGYVHMAGEHPEDESESAPDEFTAKPIWQRATVAIAGPAANFITAFLMLWFMFMIGVEEGKYMDQQIVGAVKETSAAAKAGFQAGDSIVAVNGQSVESWHEIQELFAQTEKQYTITFIRDDVTMNRTIDMDKVRKDGFEADPFGGLVPPVPAKVGKVMPDYPAKQAGVQEGDSILAVNGRPIYSFAHMQQIVEAHDTAQGPVELTIERDGQKKTLQMPTKYSEENKQLLIGIQLGALETRIIRYGPLRSVNHAAERSWEYTTMIFDVLGKLFSREVSADQLAGPVGIVQMSGLVALGGLAAILNFMALIGINLAVINLFPLVITDGGLLFFLLLEKIRGKPLSLKSQMLINKIALVFFIALFLFVTFNDVKRFGQFFRMFR
jgi:regulator of sigma E protease